MKKLFTTIVLLAVFALTAQAQFVGSTANYGGGSSQSSDNSSAGFGGFSIYVGGAFPMGDFKEGSLKNKFPNNWILYDDDGRKGFAGTGFNIGWDALIPVSKNGLGIFLGMDYFRNGYNSAMKKFVKDNDEVEKAPRVSNFIPLMFGLRYLGNISNNFGIWGEAGIGPNIRMISKLEVEWKGTEYDYYGNSHSYEETLTTKYNTAVTFAFKIGVGVMIAKHFSIGLDYYGLGSAQVKATDTWEYHSSYYGNEHDSNTWKGKDLKCSNLVFRAGVKF